MRASLSLVAVAAALVWPAAALAAPPANDAPTAAGAFQVITAENGTPTERQAIAEPREATPDPGVPRCLGAASFERTVWFRIDAADVGRELAVEASGRTTDVLDLAAFVQPEGAPADRPLTAEPNACGGLGSGGADASEEPTAGVILRVPPRRSVLIQVGRRGAAGSEEDERAVLSLAARDLPGEPGSFGDAAGDVTPSIGEGTSQLVGLGGATITEDDPAQPPCPSLGTVWRRFVPAASGTRAVAVDGPQAATLTVFNGDRPTGDNVEGCVNRERSAGEIAMTVPVRAGVPVWVRIGTDRPPADAAATLRVSGGPGAGGGGGGSGSGGSGGPGSGPGGSGGGSTSRCVPASRRSLARQRISFRRRASRPKNQNRFRTFPIRLGAVRVRLCRARVSLVGPRGRTYARGRIDRVSGRRPRFRLRRVRKFVPGTYRLKVTALSSPGAKRVRIKTRGRARFR